MITLWVPLKSKGFIKGLKCKVSCYTFCYVFQFTQVIQEVDQADYQMTVELFFSDSDYG